MRLHCMQADAAEGAALCIAAAANGAREAAVTLHQGYGSQQGSTAVWEAKGAALQGGQPTGQHCSGGS